MRDKGFTLIEMLIVIAVIGVLAIAVLSAINPVEQMRKARDTRRRSNAAELLNALERYYATHEDYPADYSAAAGGTLTCSTAIANRIASTHLATLVSDNEVKSEFTDRIDDSANYLYSSGDFGGSDLINVCYQIESRANITKYTGSDIFCGSDPYYVCVPE
jgi:prepilin-type N-terminal cleavage/methylation domain-containing protein